MRVARPLSEARAEPGARLRRFHGACACGTVRFLVTADPAAATPCICARCRGQGLRIVHAPRASFRMLTGQDALTERLADARTPHHFFCARCGEAVFGLPPGRADGPVSVNVALLGRGDPNDVTPQGGPA